jgi:hypothetical protein
MVAVVIGLVFSPIAGVMASLITYHEYRRHYPAPGPARRLALQTGFVAMVVFLALSSLAGVLLQHVFGGSAGR